MPESMGDKEKGQKRPGSLLDDRSEDRLAVSLYLEGGSTGQGSIKHETGGSVKVSATRKEGCPNHR
jgi:hypothetical protein